LTDLTDTRGWWRKLAAVSGTDLILAGFGVMTSVLMGRLLQPEGRGAVAAFILWPLLFQAILSFGMEHGAILLSARNRKRLNALVGCFVLVSAVLGGAIAALGLGLLPWLMQDYSPSLRLWTGVLFAMTPVMLLTGYLLGMLQGVGRFATFNLLRLTQTVVYFLGIVALGVSGTLTPEHVAVVFISTHVVAALAVGWTCRAHVFPLAYDGALLRQLLSFGRRTALSVWFSQLNTQLPQAYLATFASPAILGLFAVANACSQAASVLGTGVQRLVVSETANAADPRRVILRHAGLAAAFLVPPSLGLVVIMPWLVDSFFGKSYLPTVKAAQLLSLSVVMLVVQRTLANGLRGCGRTELVALPELLGILATGGCLAVLVPWLGVTGAGIAGLAGTCALLTATLVTTLTRDLLPVAPTPARN
jgi:O-antigen/teichoic acid export membrane protein